MCCIIQSDWSINLGKNVIEIEVVNPKTWGASNTLVLGEHSLFCCHENGTVNWMMKLDYNPSCLHVYNVSTANEGMLVYHKLLLYNVFIVQMVNEM